MERGGKWLLVSQHLSINFTQSSAIGVARENVPACVPAKSAWVRLAELIGTVLALVLGLVAIIAAPFSVMHGGVHDLVDGQARSGGSAHATENPSRSTFGSSFTRPPIWKPTTWACSSPTTSNEASLPRKGM